MDSYLSSKRGATSYLEWPQVVERSFEQSVWKVIQVHFAPGAPELLNRMRYDWACDSWSFACLLETLWSHEPVFSSRARSADAAVAEVRAGTLRPTVPRDTCLWELVNGCAATAPDERFPSAQHVE